MTTESGIAARRALEACERGDASGLDAALAAISRPADPVSTAWRFCLAAVGWSFDPAAPAPPTPSDLAPFVAGPAEARAAAAETCVQMERLSVLAFDTGALSAWVAVHRTLVARGADPAQAVHLSAAEWWLRVLSDDEAVTEADLGALVRQASEARVASVVVEATVLTALAAAGARGDLPGAVEAARRAARMAQAEELMYPSFLAHLVLARMRRLTGRPHLALHILTALGRGVPACWQPWLAWELALSGAERTGPALLPRVFGREPLSAWPSVRACHALYDALTAARAGRRPALVAAAAALPAPLAGVPGLGRDARALLTMLDGGVSDEPDLSPLGPPPPEVQQWCAGVRADVPFGLHAAGQSETAGGAGQDEIAYVLATPGQPGRRVLRPGRKLAANAHDLEESAGAERGGARTDTGLAVLALAGPAGLPREEFFRAVYLFPFAPEVHQGVLDLLVLRMRRRVGPRGELTRRESDHALVLELHEPVLIPDARCAEPVADRLLHALAAAGPVSAEEAAKKLGISSRSVRRVFQQLLEEGVLAQERLGHNVAYRVHDTTFTQVTMTARPAPSRLP
jgi:biotin operon repressor